MRWKAQSKRETWDNNGEKANQLDCQQGKHEQSLMPCGVQKDSRDKAKFVLDRYPAGELPEQTFNTSVFFEIYNIPTSKLRNIRLNSEMSIQQFMLCVESSRRRGLEKYS